MVFETLNVCENDAVVFAEIAAQPMNLLGRALVRDLVSFIQQADADNANELLVLNVGYAEAGPANGPPVMLLHGWPYDIHTYVDVASQR